MRLSIIFLFFWLSFFNSSAQKLWTPYDDMPCIQANIKPQYDESMAEWEKMFYDYPINYHKLIEARNSTSINKSPNERYFKV